MTMEWVMVPREPTLGMLSVWDEFRNGAYSASAAYRAMLDAAPAAPQQVEPVKGVVWQDDGAARIKRGDEDDYCARHSDARRLYLHPPALKAPVSIDGKQAEPVTTLIVHLENSGGHAVSIDAPYVDLPIGEHKLYLHPPPAEVQRLRDAALAVLREYNAHGGLCPSAMNPLINELHHALEGRGDGN